MSNDKHPCDNPCSLLGIKKHISPKELKAKHKKLLKYNPINSPKSYDKEFEEKCHQKYTRLMMLINGAYSELRDEMNVNSKVNQCLQKYKTKLNSFSIEELQFILSENDSKINGDKQTLIRRIIDNEIPYRVAELNVWQFKNQPNIENILANIPRVKLIRILELKNLDSTGNNSELKDRITSNCNISEIQTLLNTIESEYSQNEKKLQTLNEKQLQIILKYNNINFQGNKHELIKKIIDNLTNKEIEINIDELPLHTEKALQKVYEIIGYSDFTPYFKNKLKRFGLGKTHGNQIKNQLINSIKSFNIIEKDIENELDRLLKIKSNETEKESLNYLYDITGEKSLSYVYLKILELNSLSEDDGIEIRNNLVTLIKSKQITQDEIESKLEELINKKFENNNKALIKAYNIIGKTEFNKEFLNMLRTYDLTEKQGQEIKDQIIYKINNLEIREDQVLDEINAQLQVKAEENENKTLKYLYDITGKNALSQMYLQILELNGLSEEIGFEIRNELINLLKSKQISENEIEIKLEELINEHI